MGIVMLHRLGLSKRQIAGRLGIHRDTVSRHLERGGRAATDACGAAGFGAGE